MIKAREFKESIDDVFEESAPWSDATFPQATPKSIATHLAREAEELKENPGDPMEMADVALLLAHLASRYGVDLAMACRIKLEINKRRQWGEVDKEGVVEHVREEDKTLDAPAKKMSWDEEQKKTWTIPVGSIFEVDDQGRLTGRRAVFICLDTGEIAWGEKRGREDNAQASPVRYLRTEDKTMH